MKVEMIDYTQDLEAKIAQAARICYGKEENTQSTEKLLKRLRNDSHFATFRFATVTFQISEFSRSCSMQMLRHAFLDYLQRSQRYVKEFQFGYVVPPSIAKNPTALAFYTDLMDETQEKYDNLIFLGIPKEDARMVLPNACHTKMNIIGNIQAWYDFLHGAAGRLQPSAQWEIREIAVEIDKQLHTIAPNIFSGTGEYRTND